MSHHSEFNGFGRSEPVGPRQLIGGPIDVILSSIRPMTGFPEHSAGDVAPKIDPVHRGPGCLESDTSGRYSRHRDTQRAEFLVEHLFQPTRAGCKKSVFCAIHALRLLYRHGGHEVLRRMREIRLAENPSGRQPSTIRLRFVPGHSLP